ncbi:hypothetical protein ACV3P9_14875 [Clostridium perfringens]|uniref:hypothetical protein n=1 Tax=Clostridium perfringens TaxID=1502 RepID=UPI00016BD1F1|nr:hypothetical protein [Clostridium perfringens]EDT26111.1 conserved hypothetical protein [Clostridium perfringens CPE str. F4969]HBI6976330.1 hypothetical protein [Clostridium perfringens]
MKKSCENCYFMPKDGICFFEKDLKENICENYTEICECGSQAEYKYKGKYYCTDCLLKKFEIEEYTTTEYYMNGDYLGNDDDMSEVIRNLNEDIEELD